MNEIIIDEIPEFGNHSKSVLELQKRLVELGFNPKGIDGIFGSDTKNAIVALQQSNSLLGYGFIGPKTLELLHFKGSSISRITGEVLITKDLISKKARKLHPDMRQRLESILFPSGIVPDFWKESNLPKVCKAVQYAMAKLGIKEEGRDNYGIDVGKIQSTIGGNYSHGGDGQAWCLDFAQMKTAFIEDYYQKESPIPAKDNCVDCWTSAKLITNLTTQIPTEGTLMLAKHINRPGTGHAVECYELLGNHRMKTVEGNLETLFSRRDIAGFNERDCFSNHGGELKTMGYVYVYPNNRVPV